MNNYSKILEAITVVLLACMLHCQASRYWVRPNTTVDCPVGVSTENCVTLSDIAANNSKYFTSNTQIHFLPGVHYITSQTDTWIGVTEELTPYPEFSVSNISLIGKSNRTLYNFVNDCCFEPAIINCNNTNIGFTFHRVSNMTISVLKIVQCGVNVTKLSRSHGYHIALQESVFASLFLHNVEDLVLWDTTIERSIGFGLLVLRPTKIITIKNCTFHYNHVTTYNLNGTEVYFPGGNAYIGVTENCYLTISKSVIAHGFVKSKIELFLGICWSSESSLCDRQSAGLNLYLNGNININNCIFTNNTAPSGSHMLVQMSGGHSLNVSNCIFSNGEATGNGGAVYIMYEDKPHITHLMIIFSNSLFKNNTARYCGGGLFIVLAIKTFQQIDFNLLVENSTFTRNKATLGGAMYTDNVIATSAVYQLLFTIIRSTFQANEATELGGAMICTYPKQLKSRIAYHYRIQYSTFFGNIAEWGSALSLNYFRKSSKVHHPIQITDCTFNDQTASRSGSGSVIHLNEIESIFVTNTRIANNMCRGIHANMSSIEFGRNVGIYNNTAKHGAGIFFDCYPPSQYAVMSYMTINNSTLYIHDNHADSYGGGIMFESGCNNPEICFFQVPKNFNHSEGTAVQMSGNTADTAGSSIYGGSLENCYMEAYNAPLTPSMFWSSFNITEKHLGPSVVASQPYKVCVCNQNFTTDHSCSFDYNIEVYPGQTFNVPAVGVGQYNYSSPSIIRATVVNGYNAQLGEQQITQDVNLLCKNLTYSLQTLEKSVTIQLSIETPFSSESTLPELQPATLTVRLSSWI